jgi:hypothetical protein
MPPPEASGSVSGAIAQGRRPGDEAFRLRDRHPDVKASSGQWQRAFRQKARRGDGIRLEHRAHGALQASPWASRSPLRKAERRDRIGARRGLVTPGDIIPEWWATSSGISTLGAYPAGIVGDAPIAAGKTMAWATLTRHARRRRPQPFQTPNAALPRILKRGRVSNADETCTASVPYRRINDSVAQGIYPQLPGETLSSRICNGGIFMQSRFDCDIKHAQIMKLTKGVGDQFGIVSDVLETANRFEFARQVIGDLTNSGLGIAIPGTRWSSFSDCRLEAYA